MTPRNDGRNPDFDSTQQFGRVPDERPRQVFPGESPQLPVQPAQPVYEEAPRSYEMPEAPRKGKGGAAAAILGGLLALALITAGALGFMYPQAANRPAPAPVTVTATVTQTEPTTVTEMTTEATTVTETTTAEPALPTSVFDGLRGNNGNGNGNAAQQDLDALLNEMFGEPTPTQLP